MISTKHRFHGHHGLRPVYSRGRTARTAFISLKYLKRPGGRPYRAAVVVSRKVHKSAVVRNRIRRRIYEIVRQADSRLTDGRDLVFTVFSDRLAALPAAELTDIVLQLLQKAAGRSDGPNTRAAGSAEKPPAGPSTPAAGASRAIVNRRRMKGK